MKFNFTNLGLLDIFQVLKKFDHVSGDLGYAIKQTKDNIIVALNDFVAQRDELVKKYEFITNDGELDSADIDPEKYQNFLDELTPIVDKSVEVEFVQVSQDVYNKSNTYNKDCTVRDYDVLEVFFVEGKFVQN